MTPEDQYRRFAELALALSDDCVKIIGLDGTLQHMNVGGLRVMEIDDFQSVRGCPWPDFWTDQGNKDAIAAVDNARNGKTSQFKGFADTAKGSRRFWDVKVAPIFDSTGKVERIISVSRDITYLKEFEEEQSILRNELAHRIKNIIAMVQSVVNQTLKDGYLVSDVKPALNARLAAVGSAHDLLMKTRRGATKLGALAATAAEELPEGRIMFDGPDVTLASRSGLAIALALHELTTNAVKYGALSNDDGKVAIGWNVASVADEEVLFLTWTETGGPRIEHQPKRKGFGSRMIEKALSNYVRGEAGIEYRPEGLVFTLTAPVAALVEE